MDKTKLMDKIKLQLKALIESEVKFTEVKAGDLIITSPDEELIVGSEVYTVDADGNNVPLSDNTYILDDGNTITVVAGKITSIVATNEEKPENVEEEMAEPKIEEEKPAEKIEEKPAEKDEEMALLKDRVAKCEEMLAKLSEEKEKMKQQMSKISESPASKSIDTKTVEFSSIEDKRNNIQNPDFDSIRNRVRKNRK